MAAAKRLQRELSGGAGRAGAEGTFIRVRPRRAARTARSAPLTPTPAPSPQAKPLEDDILTLHYVIEGPPDSPFAGGHYHGVLKFPPEYRERRRRRSRRAPCHAVPPAPVPPPAARPPSLCAPALTSPATRSPRSPPQR
jgi:hypothetical protein